MTKKKSIRQRGKIQLSSYFREFKNDDNVAIVQEKSVPSAYPKRMIGKTGKIIGSRGSSMIIRINDGNLPKTFIVHPIHLKRIK